jgi:hypothetical protein
MDTVKKFGLSKPKAIMLFVQMLFVILITISSIFLLIFVVSHNLGPWMVTSYILISLSALAIIFYAVYGYKKNQIAYQLSLLPFVGAIGVNIFLPGRNVIQIVFLSLLLVSTIIFGVFQKNKRVGYVSILAMVIFSLVFSIYSSITANISFLGPIENNWPTYVAMYLSIFTPTIISVTFAVTYNVRVAKTN